MSHRIIYFSKVQSEIYMPTLRASRIIKGTSIATLLVRRFTLVYHVTTRPSLGNSLVAFSQIKGTSLVAQYIMVNFITRAMPVTG